MNEILPISSIFCLFESTVLVWQLLYLLTVLVTVAENKLQ